MTVLAQRILKREGYFSGTVDGDFGTYSYNATRSFQSAHGLLQDGIVGGNTWQALMNKTAYCGYIYYGYTTNLGYRITSETCGDYVQAGLAQRIEVRAYNRSPGYPTDGTLIPASLSGPTAI